MMRVGIIGTGSIAARFAKACNMAEDVCAKAVSSRDIEKAKKFAQEYNVEKAYAGTEDFLKDPAIDLVYVALPHTEHYAYSMLALKAGKNVLSEKPICVHKWEIEALCKEAKARGLFLMEGMWTRFLPNIQKAKAWVEEGRIGKLCFIDGIFSYGMSREHPVPRMVTPDTAGGSLYDVGVYVIETASFFAGEQPGEWQSYSVPWTDGVDAGTAMLLKYPSGALATLRSGMHCSAPSDFTLIGDKGRIVFTNFFSGRAVRLYNNRGELLEESDIDCELPRGFVYEIEAVRDYLKNGIKESPVVTYEDSIVSTEIMESMMHSAFPEHY